MPSFAFTSWPCSRCKSEFVSLFSSLFFFYYSPPLLLLSFSLVYTPIHSVARFERDTHRDQWTCPWPAAAIIVLCVFPILANDARIARKYPTSSLNFWSSLVAAAFGQGNCDRCKRSFVREDCNKIHEFHLLFSQRWLEKWFKPAEKEFFFFW